MPYDTDNRSGITKTASESRVIATESQKEEKSNRFFLFLFYIRESLLLNRFGIFIFFYYIRKD